jgi:N6-L-threonylcarbamoyladenine synthase
MSFSGLKTAALYALRKAQDELPRKLSDEEKQAFAREFEDAVGDVFVTKTRKALIETEAKTFVIGGGVAANRYLRERLQSLVLKEFGDPSSEQGIELRLPDLTITGDNATMIAEAALTHLLTHGIPHDQSEGLRAEGSLSLDTSH